MKYEYINYKFSQHFGLEFEFSQLTTRQMLKSMISNVWPPNEIKITGWQTNIDNKEWICKLDASCGSEAASPVLKTKRELELIKQVVHCFKQYSADITRRCAIHVHIEVRDCSQFDIAKLVSYWIKAEPIIFNMMPKYRRNCRFCKPLRNNIPKDFKLSNTADFIRMNSKSRNKSLNVRGYKNRGTIEFRLLEMTLDEEAVYNWTLFCLYFHHNIQRYGMPNNLTSFNFNQFWAFMNFENSQIDVFKIFNPTLHGLRAWMLQRIRKFAPLSSAMVQRANEVYNQIHEFEL